MRQGVDHSLKLMSVYFRKGHGCSKMDFFLAPQSTMGFQLCVSFVLKQKCRPSFFPSSALKRAQWKCKTASFCNIKLEKASQLSPPAPLTTRETCFAQRVMAPCSAVVCEGLLCTPLFDKILGTSHARVCALMRPTCNCLRVNTHLIPCS